MTSIDNDLASIRDAEIFRARSRRRSTTSPIPRASASSPGSRPEGYPALVEGVRPADRGSQCEPGAAKVYVEGLPPAPTGRSHDRPREGRAFGVTFEDINEYHSTISSNYVNDFPNRGRMQQMIVQADRDSHMNADDILNYNVKKTAASWCRSLPLPRSSRRRGRTQIAGFNLSCDAHQRRGEASHQRRRHRRDGAAGEQLARRLRL